MPAPVSDTRTRASPPESCSSFKLTVPPSGEYLMALSSRLAKALHEEIAVSRHPRPRRQLDHDLLTFLLRGGLVELGEIAQQRRHVHLPESRAQVSRLDPRDAQQRVEGGEEAVRLFDRGVDLGRRIAAGACPQGLELVAQPAQRRAQIMGDVVRHLPHLVHRRPPSGRASRSSGRRAGRSRPGCRHAESGGRDRRA